MKQELLFSTTKDLDEEPGLPGPSKNRVGIMQILGKYMFWNCVCQYILYVLVRIFYIQLISRLEAVLWIKRPLILYVDM